MAQSDDEQAHRGDANRTDRGLRVQVPREGGEPLRSQRSQRRERCYLHSRPQTKVPYRRPTFYISRALVSATIKTHRVTSCSITAPSLSEKSQSHREISRSRGVEKREVSFNTPAQRTRSLTREEARTRDDENARFGYNDRSASAQRLATTPTTTDRPSRADSRVTFAPDTLEKDQPPIPPARSRDHASAKPEVPSRTHANRSNSAAEVKDKVRYR